MKVVCLELSFLEKVSDFQLITKKAKTEDELDKLILRLKYDAFQNDCSDLIKVHVEWEEPNGNDFTKK